MQTNENDLSTLESGGNQNNKLSLLRDQVIFPALVSSLLLGSAHANDMSISVWGGINESPNSSLKLNNSNGKTTEHDVRWEGRSTENPAYWGIRGAYEDCLGENIHCTLSLTHAKAYAKDLENKKGLGKDFNHLEFTDGNNIGLIGLQKEWKNSNKISTYVGGGVGIAVPHVEVDTTKDSPIGESEIREYQLAGPAAEVYVGTKYKVSKKLSIILEGGYIYSKIDADLADGNSLETELKHKQIKLGIEYNF